MRLLKNKKFSVKSLNIARNATTLNAMRPKGTQNHASLPKEVQGHVKKLLMAIKQSEQLRKQTRGRIKPGYCTLFHGPAGTGKTLTASLLGQVTGRKVKHIDLSRLVSKYIGETEKNLARLFNNADPQWILLFDEADALFGKRTSVKDSHDKYANQEVSYLLQRIEEYAGVSILATSFKGKMDKSIMQKFNMVIPFSLPKTKKRKLTYFAWQK